MYILLAVACVLGSAAAVPSGGYGQIATINSYSIPRYEFNYAVNDPVTGDNKAQSEFRDGGLVKGTYSLAEPDGTLRVVDYTADDVRGFNANVKRIGIAAHPQQLFTPVKAIPAPIYKRIPAPIYERLPAPIYEPIAAPIYEPIAAPIYEPIAAPIYRPIAAPAYRNIIAPNNLGYPLSKNLYNLGGYRGYERELGLGLEVGVGNWNLGRLGLGNRGWNQ